MEHPVRFRVCEPFNLTKFFRDGYTVTKIETHISDYFLEQVRKQTYVTGDGYYASDGYDAPLISKWEADHVVPSYNDGAPSFFKNFWEDLSTSDYFKWFTSNFGPFSQGSPMINKYQKNSGMVWHTDSYDATFMTNILYLTGEIFTEEDGGYLGVGKCSLNAQGVMDKSTISPLDKILPNHGVFVTVNNIDHCTLHRVAEMHTGKERYSLLCHLGYAEQTLTPSRLKEIRGIS